MTSALVSHNYVSSKHLKTLEIGKGCGEAKASSKASSTRVHRLSATYLLLLKLSNAHADKLEPVCQIWPTAYFLQVKFY